MNVIKNRPTKMLECAWCCATDDLHMTKFLVIDDVICGDCLARCTDEDLGIEPMEREE